ncbi:MAG: DUF4276 family protein [Elainellaceae cyanobacterium]
MEARISWGNRSTVRELVLFLEEPSAKAMLQGFLPRILPNDIYPTYIVFEGKTDLEKSLPIKLRAWQKPDSIFVVLRDQDSGDCIEIKRKLQRICRQAEKPNALIRIACRELESWYIGDLEAVEQGLRISGLSRRYQDKGKFRNPDQLNNAAEELRKITQFKYQKISGSRRIGVFLDRGRNRSRSFTEFVSGIDHILETLKTL